MKFIKVRYQDTVDSSEVYSWLEQNCKQTYYTGTDWDMVWLTGGYNRMVQFVSEEDATLFSLRWG